MKGKMFSIILIIFMIIAYNIPVINVRAGEIVEEIVVDGNHRLLHETSAITQKDYEDGFQSYASADATVDFSSTVYNLSKSRPANVVGVVKDYDTDALISGAEIFVDGEKVVETDTDGRFQLMNFPSGVYDWEISAEGYLGAVYYKYSVDGADGSTIFTFYIDKDVEVTKNREEILNNHMSSMQVSTDIVEVQQPVALNTTRALNTIPKVDNSVSVYYNSKTQSIDRETYIYTVLSSELYETSYYSQKGLSEAQIKELYIAQAIAANTFLEYSLSVYSQHSGSSYDVCSSTCCQVYDPTKVTQAAIDATTSVFYTLGVTERTLIVLHQPTSSSFDYIWGAFFSSCYGQGTKTHNTQSALQKVDCTDIATGYGGHRYGLCQMGAAVRAKNGDVARDILLYYYSDCCLASCVLN